MCQLRLPGAGPTSRATSPAAIPGPHETAFTAIFSFLEPIASITYQEFLPGHYHAQV